ncbi:HU family DNA-binding protein [Maritimibacter sp. 55A14]|uniref:HU family DNA-binding protein n=1 Tax=Maritimibacter sp. 55A14 TaxID=2174844 RepID=UPI0011B1D427|nr:HU family DNA-binding protein [Maritimibacter sp. 55A14]
MSRPTGKSATTPRKTAATPRKSAAAKSASASRKRVAASKPAAPAAPAPTPTPTAKPVPVSAVATLTPKPAKPPKLDRKELLDRVTAGTGMGRNEVRKVLDAALVEMRATLAAGADLDISPLGKVKYIKTKQGRQGEVLICRVKLDEAPEKTATDPLAKPASAR